MRFLSRFRTNIRYPISVAALAAAAAFVLAACGDSADQQDQQQDQQSASDSVQVEASQQTQQDAATQRNDTPSDQQQQAARQQQDQSPAEQQSQDDPQPSATVTRTPAGDDDDQDDELQAADVQTETEQEAPAQQVQQAEQDKPDQDSSDEGQPSGGSEQEQPAQQQEEAQEDPAAPPEPTAAEQLQLRAQEIAANATVSDLVDVTRWLNGEETSIALELAKGNVVLIDFWTYTCINCVRTLPFLTEWHDKYAPHGLRIFGVHTPEFDFERDPDNVLQAIEQYGIQYVVPQDNDYRTWRAFSNRYWPAKYLIGPTMDVRYQHFGEGDYLETELQIRAALEDAGADLSDVPVGTVAVAPVRDPTAERQTRELYAGTRRNYNRPYAAQEEYYLEANVAIDYTDIDTDEEDRANNFWYVHGLWRNEPESIVHARTTENLEDYFAFDFVARSVNVVMSPGEGGEPYDVFIEMDGRWLDPRDAGDDIRFDEQGRSFVRVTKYDLFRLVNIDVWSRHELKLSSNSDQFRIFAFTFGSYLGGE